MRAAEDSRPRMMRALTFSFARVELLVGGRLSPQALELLAHHGHRLGEVVGPRADVQADLARVRELAREREDAVGEPALLAHGLEEP